MIVIIIIVLIMIILKTVSILPLLQPERLFPSSNTRFALNVTFLLCQNNLTLNNYDSISNNSKLISIRASPTKFHG